MKKKLLTILLSISMLLSMAPWALAAPGDYTDLRPGAWYEDAIDYVLEKGIMAGTGGGTFSPDGIVTRGMVFQTLYNLEGRPEAGTASFSDVAGKWYAAAAAWAQAAELTSGTGKGLFSGEAAMTRQELAKVLTDYAKQHQWLPEGSADLSAYDDAASIAAWAEEGMNAAVALGLLKGSGNRLNPAGTARRAELAQMLKNLSTLAPTGNGVKVAMLIPGAIDDGGYYQAGYEGLMRIKRELGAEVSYLNNIPTELADLTAALRKLAEQEPDMILSHGGITAAAVEAVSKEYPNIQFVLSQGNVHGPNLSVYQVNYDQATWLCGAAAGLLTQTGVVSHISGVRVAGGLNARGAFANGLAYTNPDATFLTTFTGDLNDAALARRTVEAQIAQGSDLVFAMLNDAMPGVTAAVKAHGIRQVADVYDLSATEPDVYALSALEDIGLGLFEAVKRYQEGDFQSDVIKSFGLETEGAVGIAFAQDVPQEVLAEIEALKAKIISGEIQVSNEFTGEEFEPVLQPLKVAMVIPGKIDDGGFMQGGYEGLMKIQKELGAEVRYLDDVAATDEALTAAIEELAAGKPDMLMAHGGQCAQAMQAASEKYPDIQFVVLHGDVSGKNLSSYGVVQEQAAYLAGAAAGLLTETGVVGHMSGLRVPAGVKARGAFADGLKRTNPEAVYLTNFSGDLNDQALAYQIANAEIDAGADIIFAMLNDGMPGVTKAVEERGIHQVADSKDRTATEPDVFMISAVSNVSMSAFTAASDYVEGRYQPGVIRAIGIETPGAIDVALAPYVPDAVKQEMEKLKEALKDGTITVDVVYTGVEFEPDV